MARAALGDAAPVPTLPGKRFAGWPVQLRGSFVLSGRERKNAVPGSRLPLPGECAPLRRRIAGAGGAPRFSPPHASEGGSGLWPFSLWGSAAETSRKQEPGGATEYSSGSPWFDDDDVTILHAERSEFNNIKVLEISRRADNELAGARVLVLDGPGNIHSIYFPYKPWTDSYYDRFAALPPLIPKDGPIGILGLGAGSAARAISYAWPDVHMVGWELDPAVVEVAFNYFDLSELEVRSGRLEPAYNPLVPDKWGWGGQRRGSCLRVEVGDALAAGAVVEGGFAGLVVDLFSGGVVIPQLQQVATWSSLLGRLMPEGRVMVNCGGGCVESEAGDDLAGERVMWSTLLALRAALPKEQELMCRRLDGEGGNVLALSVGCPQDLELWLECRLPAQVVDSIDDWVPFHIFISAEMESFQEAATC